MDTPILDLSYLYEVSENDDQYMLDVITLFLDTVPHRLVELEYKIRETDDFDAISHLSHFLKSSANIIKINKLHDNLSRIELLAKQEKGKPEMINMINEISDNFKQALPLIVIEAEKHKMNQ